MKCLIVCYIGSARNIYDVESIMEYYKFNITENNSSYRVFSGNFYGSASRLANKLNTELEEMEFDIEDSIFMVYPVNSPEGTPSLSSMVIKRKGNKYLRNKFLN